MDGVMCRILFSSFLIVFALEIFANYGIAYNFTIDRTRTVLNKETRSFLNNITPAEWKEFVNFGTESVEKQKRLEGNLLDAQISIENGSLSHIQLLDTLPNPDAIRDGEIALKILKSSLYVYNSKCAQHGISERDCQLYLENKDIPRDTLLWFECNKIVQSKREGHHAFRRLLPRHYDDGFYGMFKEDRLPPPRIISGLSISSSESQSLPESLEDATRNLVLVQWSQFIEHDLSKPVATSMLNHASIECCNKNHNKLSPRFRHPSCAPLLLSDEQNRFGQPSCLNYVRSSLAVGSKCMFGAAEQLNQATGYLDLSQLYGFTESAEHKMRAHKNGKLKSTDIGVLQRDLLPLTINGEGHTFCAFKSGSNFTSCFMAGDSRVNNSPYTILLYTLFLRNHNKIAHELHLKHSDWKDEQLYHTAKRINIKIYRRIVINEWLPSILGEQTVKDIIDSVKNSAVESQEFEISNEFAVAAIRFHFSMIANKLYNIISEQHNAVSNNNAIPAGEIFILQDQLYKPQLVYTARQMDELLDSILQQNAMKMDAHYAQSLMWNGSVSMKPTNIDILSFDIQRGRDHGLQPYVKYLEICNGIEIDGWTDLEKFIPKEIVEKLKGVYRSWSDVDLIVGGICESPIVNSTVGPTFNCILAEQFSKIYQKHLSEFVSPPDSDFNDYQHINGKEFLCLNSNLKSIPENIFKVASESNKFVSCVDKLKPIKI